MGKVLIAYDAGSGTETYNTPDVERWELDGDEWDGADPVQKRLLVDGLEGCEELWPAWFRKEVEEFKQGWNSEVVSL